MYPRYALKTHRVKQFVGMAAICALVGAVNSADAKPRLARIFGDNMVLQQGRAIPLWGWANPGEKVTVSLLNATASATADTAGAWRVSLPAQKAGGPFVLTAVGADTVRIANVMIGEVWLCSGQSNMEFGMRFTQNSAEEIARANYPSIRFMQVTRRETDTPESDLPAAQWLECSPSTIATANAGSGFSAVAYFFGRELADSLKVPIGLIQSAWGGTPCEAWTNPQAIGAVPALKPIMDEWDKYRAKPKLGEADYRQRLAAWENATTALYADTQMVTKGWAKPSFVTSSWQKITVPGFFEKSGIAALDTFDGVLWYRRTVSVPDKWAGKELLLRLGPIDDFDHTFFNGTLVGTMGPTTPNYWVTPRSYRIPASLVKKGKAVIAVRLFDNYSGGGFPDSAQNLRLSLPGDSAQASIALAGEWVCQVERALDARRPEPPGNPGAAGCLYNGMIRPLIPLAIRGVIWYQGETNAPKAYQYRTLLPTMINNWRAEWGEGDFPFILVQLANYMPRKPVPVESEWAELREAQLMTLSLPNTGMAVAIDLGDTADIHPRNKQDVGHRLAAWALARTYGKKIAPSGPLYRSMKSTTGAIALTFAETGRGLCTRANEPLKGFQIAGADKKFVWADARIEGKTVVVSSPQIAQPVAVRYAWQDSPDCNLYNKDGLPASPFRTDDWPGLTVDK